MKIVENYMIEETLSDGIIIYDRKFLFNCSWYTLDVCTGQIKLEIFIDKSLT